MVSSLITNFFLIFKKNRTVATLSNERETLAILSIISCLDSLLFLSDCMNTSWSESCFIKCLLGVEKCFLKQCYILYFYTSRCPCYWMLNIMSPSYEWVHLTKKTENSLCHFHFCFCYLLPVCISLTRSAIAWPPFPRRKIHQILRKWHISFLLPHFLQVSSVHLHLGLQHCKATGGVVYYYIIPHFFIEDYSLFVGESFIWRYL